MLTMLRYKDKIRKITLRNMNPGKNEAGLRRFFQFRKTAIDFSSGNSKKQWRRFFQIGKIAAAVMAMYYRPVDFSRHAIHLLGFFKGLTAHYYLHIQVGARIDKPQILQLSLVELLVDNFSLLGALKLAMLTLALHMLTVALLINRDDMPK